MATQPPFPHDSEATSQEIWRNPALSFDDDDEAKPPKGKIFLPANYRIQPVGEYCEQIELSAKRVEHKNVRGIDRLEQELKAGGVDSFTCPGKGEVETHVLAYFEEQHRELLEGWLNTKPPYIASIGIDGLSTSISPN